MAEVNNIKRKLNTSSIKNKKTVKQSLAKASIKGKIVTKKATNKTPTVKKTVKPKEIEVKLIDEKELEVITKKEPAKKTSSVKKEVKRPKYKKEVKTPNNKIEENKEEKEVKETIETNVKKEVKEPNNIKRKLKNEPLTKRELRKKEKEKRKKEKAKLREQKKLEKEKKKKEKEKEKKSKKPKIEGPKEWKLINTKNTKKIEEETEVKPKGFKGRLKSSIFESIDEKQLKERKRKSREKLKRDLIILLILAILIGVIVFSLLKYNDFVKKQLAVYEPYRIGDKVRLQDDSIWYVIVDSDSKNDEVKLLSIMMVDVNNDGMLDASDLVKYNTTNTAEYDSENEGSIAYVIKKYAKGIYEEKIGKIEEMGILKSKEFVKVRERMNFGDEWTQGNWLASDSCPKYWIESEQNNKVFVVTSRGTYILVNPDSSYFIRPTIVIKKDLVTKIEEKRRATVDLINGLKRK